MSFSKFPGNILLLTILLSYSGFSFAQDISFSGWGATGYKFLARNPLNAYNQESYYEGKLQADIKVNKKIEAQLDLRGNSRDKSVNFREFSIKFEYFDYIKFKVGNLKKPFAYQYIETNREDLITVDRSLVVENMSLLGFGGRSVSLMAYYKYSQKRPDFPYSYYFSIYSSNSQNYGLAGRFGYHLGKFSIAANYLLQSRGGEEKISAHGLGMDFALEDENTRASLELFYVQDPVEGLIQRLQNENENVFAGGASFSGAYKFKIGGEIVKHLEPVLLLSFFLPESEETEAHVIQSVIGFNLYFQKNVIFRFNGDLRLTKNEYNDDYTTNDSRGVFEFLIRF